METRLLDQWQQRAEIATEDIPGSAPEPMPLLIAGLTRAQVAAAVAPGHGITQPSSAPASEPPRRKRIIYVRHESEADLIAASAIIDAVCAHSGVARPALLSRIKPDHVVWARSCAVTIIRNRTRIQLKSLGKIFGRDISSLCYMQRYVRDECATSAKSAAAFAALDLHVTSALHA